MAKYNVQIPVTTLMSRLGCQGRMIVSRPVDTGWERICSGKKFIYWRRKLTDGSYLTVTHATAASAWTWRHRGPGYAATPEGVGTVINAEGQARDSRAARRAADRATRGAQ